MINLVVFLVIWAGFTIWTAAMCLWVRNWLRHRKNQEEYGDTARKPGEAQEQPTQWSL